MISRVSKIGFFNYSTTTEENSHSIAMDEKHSDLDEVDGGGNQPQTQHDQQPNTNNPQNMLLKDAFSDRKNLVRGLCDASLIAANISQLRAVLDSDPDNKFYIPLLTLIGFSLLSHIVFGIIIIQMWRVQRKSENKHLSDAQTSTTAKAAATPTAQPQQPQSPNESQDQNQERTLETIVHDRIPCIDKKCTHCRRYETYDDLSILVVFFLVVFNVAISGLGLPTISQNC